MQAITDWITDNAITMKNSFDLPNVRTFKQRYSIDQRYSESRRVLEKYHGERIPIICERARNSRLGQLRHNKFLVPRDLTMAQFMYVIRKHLKLDASTALYIYVNGSTIYSGNMLISTIYEYKKDPDGFLYVIYNSENTFG